MTVDVQGWRSGWSPCQSKSSWVTTHFGAAAASSTSENDRSFCGDDGIVADGGAKIAARERRDRGGVGIHHELVRIEAMPLVRRVRSGDAKPVELAGPDPLQPDVPDVAGLVPGRIEDDAPGRHGVLGTGEEVEADAGGVPAEDGEVDAIPARMGAEGQGHARADGLNLAQLQEALELGELLRARVWSGHTCRHRVLSPAATRIPSILA